MSDLPPASQHTFQVDLRGIVDLLSHHLYSSPQVYIRELLQNAVDAVALRDGLDSRPAVRLIGADVAPDGRMHCLDSGIGLDTDDVATFLATIGGSSKRDLSQTRSDLLGQFGIGLLSTFLVTDEIEVVTRKGNQPLVRWRAHSDGSYTTDTVNLDPDDPRADWLASGPGTCVALTPRHGSEHWLLAASVTDLGRRYGRFLPEHVESQTPHGTVSIAPLTPPWLIENPQDRRQAVLNLAADELGTAPFATLPVSVPAAGLSGVALILGQPNPAARPPGSRVYLKGMLLGADMPGLLPPWAFFVRLVVNTSSLRPTASRESLYEDQDLEHTRQELGDQIRRWLVRMAASERDRMQDFLRLHSVAVKAMALTDPQMLQIVLPLLRFEANSGETTLPELARSTDVIYVTRTLDDFRQVAQVGAAQGMAIINGGYVYERDLVLQAPSVLDGVRVVEISPDDLDQHIRGVTAARLTEVGAALAQLRGVLDRLDVDLELRGFAPASLPAVYLHSPTAQERRQRRQVAADADDTWSAILHALDDGGSDRPRLLLNDDNPTVQRLLALDDPGLATIAVESLYTRALLTGHHPMRPADVAALDRSFSALLDRAIDGGSHG